MFVYAYNDLSKFKLNLESLDRIMLKRFQLYYLPNNVQCDTEEIDHYDRMAHLLMCFVAFDYPVFANFFVRGELKIFMNKLKRKGFPEAKEELSRLLINFNYLSQREEIRKFAEKDVIRLKLVSNTLEKLIENSSHAFGDSHSENCSELMITLPFTFLLESVSKREVEVFDGRINVHCRMWNEILRVIFVSFLELEMKLLKGCRPLREAIYHLEDDRIRQVIKRFTNVLSGRMSKGVKVSSIKANELDSMVRFFPPCMANLHQILKRTHRLSYESRYQYTLFLRDIGMPVNENVSFWRNEYSKPCKGSSCTHDWKEKEDRYKYQIEHLYGLMGNSRGEPKTSHSCEKFIGELNSKMDGGCPFQHSSAESLLKSIPKSISELTDVEDIFKYKSCRMPRMACATFLSCQRRAAALKRKKRFADDGGCGPVKDVPCIISPLQYYNAAIDSLEM